MSLNGFPVGEILQFPRDEYRRRFWGKVDIRGADDCWNWQASTQGTGYGYASIGWGGEKKRVCLSHRLAYAVTKGVPDPYQVIMHTCHNKLCCNPAHLTCGGQKENMRQSAPFLVQSKAKLTWEQVDVIRKSEASSKKLAKEFNVCVSNINFIRAETTWKPQHRSAV